MRKSPCLNIYPWKTFTSITLHAG
ncbi:hypothetical protein FOF76_05490 [Lactobacillus gasseri]|nr:hypothetical protein FOF76_05490 [Lactobacillus gasseri]